jgi:small GTP-binding protein
MYKISRHRELPLMVVAHRSVNAHCQRCCSIHSKCSSIYGIVPTFSNFSKQFQRCFTIYTKRKNVLFSVSYNRVITFTQWNNAVLPRCNFSTTTIKPDPDTTSSTNIGVITPNNNKSSIHNNDETTIQMGIFRLLNDTQRVLLQEQRKLTEEVVRYLWACVCFCIALYPTLHKSHVSYNISALFQLFVILYIVRHQNKNKKRSVAQRVGIQPSMSSSSTSSFTSSIHERRMEDIFQSTFVIVIAGEYNAGKSTMINALLGSKLLQTGSLPTTDSITIISSAANNNSNNDDTLNKPQQIQGHDDSVTSSSIVGDVIYHPVSTLPLLHDMTIVDTPGTNAVLTDHTIMTMRILPSADLIIFVTSADRPFPESERTLLESISILYRKSIVVVINKMDILDDTGGDHGTIEKRRVVQYVTDHTSTLLGAQPIVIPISARDALAAKLTGRVPTYENTTSNIAGWQRSNFGTLERFLQETLTTETKIKSKLVSPIGVTEGILDQCKQRLKHETEDIGTDINTVNLINSQFNAWKKELISDMQTTTNDIQILLRNEGRRGSILLERMTGMDLYRSCLFDMSNLRREWKKTKPLSVKQYTNENKNCTIQEEIRSMVTEMANAVALVSRAQGQAMIEYLGKRPAMKNQSLLGSVTAASQYEDTRRNLEYNLIHVMHKNIDFSESELEESLLDRLQKIVLLSAALNVGSVSTALVCFTQYIDVTIALTTSTLFLTSSVFVWQLGRRNWADQYAALWSTCSRRLDVDIQDICSKETDRVCRRIRDGITPYTLFVEAEHERLRQLTGQCEGLTAKARQLRNKITNVQ